MTGAGKGKNSVGTASDNTTDGYQRGRMSRELSDEEVQEIRDRYASEDVTQYELAEEYRVDQAHISNIVNNQRRTKVT